MPKTYKMKATEQTVMELALERIRLVYERFDDVQVLFSGGKDSTVCLNLALKVARELGKLPVKAVYWDEEANTPETNDYVRRVANNPDVSLRWFCFPIVHRNACSPTTSTWSPWAPEDKDLWCYPLPPEAITEIPGAPTAIEDRLTIPEVNKYIFDKKNGRVGAIMGIRADESIRRRRLCMMKKEDNWIQMDVNAPHVALCKPIYDWRTYDVWTAPWVENWDYNKTYDILSKIGTSPYLQRVAPPFGQEPFKRLWQYPQCWPELWEKMLKRVPGVAAAGRYSRSPLYGVNIQVNKPEGMSWEEAILMKLNQWPEEQRLFIAKRIKSEIAKHNNMTNNAPIPDGSQKGMSWDFLFRVAMLGDLKKRMEVKYDIESYKRGHVGPAGNRVVK